MSVCFFVHVGLLKVWNKILGQKVLIFIWCFFDSLSSLFIIVFLLSIFRQFYICVSYCVFALHKPFNINFQKLLLIFFSSAYSLFRKRKEFNSVNSGNLGYSCFHLWSVFHLQLVFFYFSHFDSVLESWVFLATTSTMF